MIKIWKIFGVEMHPIGDVVINTTGVNPGNRFKGTWELISIGRMLIGVDPNDIDFNASKKTGGAKTHKHFSGIVNYNNSDAIGYRSEAQNVYGFSEKVVGWDRSAVASYSTNRNVRKYYTSTENNIPPFYAVYIWERVA